MDLVCRNAFARIFYQYFPNLYPCVAKRENCRDDIVYSLIYYTMHNRKHLSVGCKLFSCFIYSLLRVSNHPSQSLVEFQIIDGSQFNVVALI